MINFQSPEWFAIKKWAENEIERLRVKNDAIGLLPEETSAIRGEIRVLKRICNLQNAMALEVGEDNAADY